MEGVEGQGKAGLACLVAARPRCSSCTVYYSRGCSALIHDASARLQLGGHGGQRVRRHRAAGHRQRQQVAQEQLLAQVLAVVLAAQHAAIAGLGALGRGA